MNRALWLLMKLRLVGWGRRFTRQLSTVRGALVTIFFGLLTLFWIGGMCINAFLPRPGGGGANPEHVERFAPLALFAYCLAMLSMGSNSASLNFTLPEVQFLFAGPFSRRQILTYKIVSQFLLLLPACVFVSFAARQVAGTYLSGLIAAVLILSFMQLFGTAYSLIASTIDERTHSRSRRLILMLIVVAAAAAVYAGWRASGGGTDDTIKVLLRIEQSDIVQYGLLPFRWYARVLAATQFDGRFFLNAGLALGLNLFMMALVYALDAQYTEAAATAAEKRYAVLERLRRGGLAGMSAPTAKKVGYRTPDPPSLGGIGPILWRQMIAAIRSRRVLGVLIFATLMSCIGPLIATVTNRSGSLDQALPWTLAGMGLIMSILLSHTLAFDFRSDVDRMEVLKTLPIPAYRIVIGQLLTPVILTSVYQILLIGLVYLVLGRIEVLLATTVLMAWPVNLLLTGIDNLMFLLFPTRMAPASPGDFSHAGRQMLMLLGKGIGMAIGLGIPLTFGAITYHVTRNWAFAIISAFIPTLMVCALPLPLVTMAFVRFDVARDMPP